MLTNELMGVLALGILWVNVALISADALLRARDLHRLSARWSRGLVRARATAAVARFVVEQTGRHGSADTAARQTIRFHDRAYRTERASGTVAVEGHPIELLLPERVEVWVSRAELHVASSCSSASAFDAAYADAKKARGLHREVVVPLADTDLWILGRVGETGIEPLEGPEPIVSTVEPLGLLRAARAKLLGFVAGLLVLAAGCTALALVPPVFGLVSTLGGAACLALFLLAQPAGTWMRDLCKRPSERPLRGVWVRPAGALTETARPA